MTNELLGMSQKCVTRREMYDLRYDRPAAISRSYYEIVCPQRYSRISRCNGKAHNLKFIRESESGIAAFEIVIQASVVHPRTNHGWIWPQLGLGNHTIEWEYVFVKHALPHTKLPT
jgi:hypothetical protein